MAIEVDGCYWHGCGKCGFSVSRSADHLYPTIRRNAGKFGWKFVRLWEHDVRSGKAEKILGKRLSV